MAILMKAKGLQTFKNNLSEIPEGALLEATNVVIDRDGIIEPRRGFKEYGETFPLPADRAKQLMVYKNRILRHYDDTIQFDNGSGDFSDFAGDYLETQTGLRIKSIEANSNFYFTTSDGIQKISAPSAGSFSTASGYIKPAGVAKALDINTEVNYINGTFLTPTSRVAYRTLWGIQDENDNLVLGGVSERAVVTNYSEIQSAGVDLTFTIPADVNTTDFFYQIYRTAVVQGTLSTIDDLEPGDEMYLVYEANVTSAQLSAGFVSVTDITPEDFRQGGSLLYTNPVSGEGILQNNDRPPLATDINIFRGSVFFSNTSTLQRLSINLLGLSDFVSGTSKLIISNGTVTNTYTFVGTKEISTVTTIASAGITDLDFFLLSGPSNERNYFVWADKTGTSLPPTNPETVGRIGIKADISAATTNTDVAVAFKTAINTLAGFDFTVANLANVMTITNVNNGPSTDVADSVARPTGFAFATTQQGTGEDISTQKVLLSGLPTPSQQVDDTSRSLVRVINRNSIEQIYAYYLSGPDDVPGAMLFESRNVSGTPFYVAVNQTGLSDQFNPTIPLTHAITAITTGTTPLITTSSPHELNVGDTVVLYGTDSTPSIDGTYTVLTTPTNSTFTITVPIAITIVGTTGTEFKGSTFSTNESAGNRIYFSKYQQPEAVPIVNYLDVGPKDETILRILPLRDSLFILKETSVYRLTGDIAPNFSVSLLDSSTTMKAADAATIINNLIYTVTTQDVITISETGVSIVSRAIEDEIVPITTYTNFSTATFGVAYQKDRAYLLFTVSNNNDDVATQCLRYNIFTNTWTVWDISKTCGIVNDFDEKLYLGASDENFIEIERKELNRKDHADRELSLEIPANALDGEIVSLSSVSDINVGDTIVQTQYVTINKFNTLLRKLDLDPGPAFNDYYSDLVMVAGDDLTNSMSALVAKLNSDPNLSGTYTFTGTTNFATIQTEYNVMIDTLNLDTGVQYTNYAHSVGTYAFESTNILVNNDNNTITLLFSLPLIKGVIALFKGISTNIVWAPQHFGDPSILKQIKEGTFIFEDNVFTTATIGYASDLSPSFEDIEFSGNGIGDWGYFDWGAQNWGGEGNQAPERTLIPRNKQRCRFLKPRFQHINAREKYAIYGISLDPRELSTRGYK